jgi:hypothetical protein
MTGDQSSLASVGNKLSDLSLGDTNRTASKAGSDVNSTHKSGSLSDESDDKSVGGDGKGGESNQPPRDPAMHGKGSKSEQPVEIIVKPHYGYRENRNGQEWYVFCTFDQAPFSWTGITMQNHLQRDTWDGLRKEVEFMRDRYHGFRQYNRVSEICDRFLEQYSKPEDMPWRSELEKVNGQPIALLLY